MLKDIKGYDGEYAVSEDGLVFSYKKHAFLSLTKTRNGYLRVVLYKKGKGVSYYIQRLVAQAFVPNPDNKKQVNHIDGNKLNNNYTNLEWMTSKENINHAWSLGLNETVREAVRKNGADNGKLCRKLTGEQVKELRSLYKQKLYNQSALSMMFNLSSGVVSKIINYQTYKEF